jgi:hypothetical protein
VFTASNNQDGSQRRPAYNYKMGFMAGEWHISLIDLGQWAKGTTGAQHDIVKGLTETSSTMVLPSTSTLSSTVTSSSTNPTLSETETDVPPPETTSASTSTPNASPAEESKTSSSIPTSAALFSRDALV